MIARAPSTQLAVVLRLEYALGCFPSVSLVLASVANGHLFQLPWFRVFYRELALSDASVLMRLLAHHGHQ